MEACIHPAFFSTPASSSSSSSSSAAASSCSCYGPHPLSARLPRSIAVAAAAPGVASKSVAQTFSDLRKQGKVALIPFITAGDPDLSTTAEALRLLSTRGADIIELGVPYSDPLADGPVIQGSATRALQKGTTLESVLKMLEEEVPGLGVPIVLFTYYNLILKQGPEKFVQAIKEAGVKGLVAPDVPLEETGQLRKLTSIYDIELTLLTTPTTPKERMRRIAEASQGFVYLVSLTGVTGARSSLEARVENLIHELKMVTEKPIAVGFGVSKPDHAAQVAKWGSDGVVVGSALVKLLSEATSAKEGLASIGSFIQDMKAALP